MTNTFKTRAPFLVNGRWQWHTWPNHEANKHAAILDKARELGASAWDFGQADHDFADRVSF
jgi:aryl-alcohol dehydrogenase-like predicted oxidoreductase